MPLESTIINGFKCHFALEGREERPVVLLSHALGVSLEMWGFQLPILRHDFSVLRYDIRGHGRSEAPGDHYSLEDLATDVAQLLDYLEISQVTFVGLSLGGMIGQTFALKYPERLSALVLCSTGSRMEESGRANMENRIAAVLREGMSGQVSGTIGRWFTPGFIDQSPATIKWISELIEATPVPGFIGCCRAIQGLNLLDHLHRIKVPTLIIPGELDQAFPIAISQGIHERIASSELSPLAGAAHLGNVEQNHHFNEILKSFLERMLD